MLKRPIPTCVPAVLLVLAGCSAPPTPDTGPVSAPVDPHSCARPAEVAVRHLSLDVAVDFEQRVLRGVATLTVDNRTGSAAELRLDSRDLEIRGATLGDGRETVVGLEPEREILGRCVTVAIGPDTERVQVEFATRPWAAALQWLEPEQTAGGRHPFLYTQSQAILARTWIPLQDTPAVRMTYDATVQVPPGLLAVMSAENPTAVEPTGVYRFTMPQPIPSYLMALAVGELAFRPTGERVGVYAEPGVVDAAAREFADTVAMMEAAERLYGAYRWGRYDLLVLPPSFPFGGMENPRLTFLTPTVIAGDGSLTSLVAHELAHSWSGNLVTNADWNGFWLNEGFTVYLERRIMEKLYGRDYSEMLSVQGLQDLEETLGDLGPQSRDTWLELDLAGRDPDDGMTDVAYEKGYLFLRMLEEAVGRERWDAFLRDYFETFAFEPVTTAAFLDHLAARLFDGDRAALDALRVDEWVFGPGLPDNTPRIHAAAFDRVDVQRVAWQQGTPAGELETAGWTTHHWLHFLRGLPDELDPDRLRELDSAFGFTGSGNSEILAEWLLHAIASDYRAAFPALERFLAQVGRRKFLRPLYRRLAATPEGRAYARDLYGEHRSGYHAIATGSIDEILGWSP